MKLHRLFILLLTALLVSASACSRETIDPETMAHDIDVRMFRFIKGLNRNEGDPASYLKLGVSSRIMEYKRNTPGTQFRILDKEVNPFKRYSRFVILARKHVNAGDHSAPVIQQGQARFEVVWRRQDGNWYIVEERVLDQ